MVGFTVVIIRFQITFTCLESCSSFVCAGGPASLENVVAYEGKCLLGLLNVFMYI